MIRKIAESIPTRIVLVLVIGMNIVNLCSCSATVTSPDFSLNLSENPGHNLFGYVNDAWISQHPVQPNQSYYNSFSEVDDRTTDHLRTICEDASDEHTTPPNLIGTFYRSGMKEDLINQQGISPITDEIDQIGLIQTRQDVVNCSIHLLTRGINPFYSYYADQDPTNASRIIPHLVQGGIGLPDRDYYFRNDSASAALQGEYFHHITNVFLLLNETGQTASVHAKQVYTPSKSRSPHPIIPHLRIATLILRPISGIFQI